MCKINKDVSDDKSIKNALLDCFITYPGEYIEEHYIYGFKQISEIAAKALSPGINDPGTALHAIDLLTMLYLAQMEIHEAGYLFDDHGRLRVIKNLISFDELLYRYLSPIRIYGKADVIVLARLLECLNKLLYADIHGEHTDHLIAYLRVIIEDARETITNNVDRKKINKLIEKINGLIDKNELLYYI
ncbi:putative orphan protein [Nitrococcus mobilis Nb-231]|uniref:Putative orphan protein n=1 Tax=Nitrococcus mobilis Nb-231 TaxID=314278 RepID=A4BVD4_9GAMM|nr:putative orphan protein [Nitrococcus mobilis Nb-231]